MNYKNTLNILHTAFKMQANLNVQEPQWQQKWLDQKIYEQILNRNKNNPQWILHDGPPYANGNIHVGHAVNKILKDFIVRIKNFQGFYSPYIPGWDTHGLPIEWALTKLGKNTDPNLTEIQKRNNCKNYAAKQILNQKLQFQRLGLLSDCKEIYQTFDHQYEMDQLNVFIKMVQKGLVYRALKPVYWSWSSKTALAEAEIVYANHQSHSIYVAMNTIEAFDQIPLNTKIVIWTTTPWTLPSNLAIAVHPEFVYFLVLVNDHDYYLVAKSRFEALVKLLKWNNYKVISEILGKKLEYLKYNNPLINETHFVICGDYVSAADGSGIVHNAPGFGLDDYLVCQEYNIEPYCPIDDDGKFMSNVKLPQLVDVFYAKANQIIIDILISKKALLFHEIITHSVAHDWRTNKPLIYRATSQWFVNIDNFKNDIIKACKNIKSYPEWVLKQLENTVLKRKEWCISRQRLWGVPIPILFDGNQEPILDLDQIKHTINVLDQKGCDSWFDLDACAFLANKYKHLKKVSKSTDIMDVWFDSGTSYSILKHFNLKSQAELYLEGSDQFRGWFNSSLITSVILYNKSPYANLISHGFILDENGLKMSKSKGNVVDPLEVCNQSGADVLRLWTASADYSEDMRLGKTIFNQAIGNYRKIRNSLFRFSLANLVDFDPKSDLIFELSDVDNYILAKFKKVLVGVINDIDNYNFCKAIKEILNFTNFYSSWYFNLIKDDLYCNALNNLRRKQIQNVLYWVLNSTIILLAPFMPHTTDEAYQFLNTINKKVSVHLEKWVDPHDLPNISVDESKWEHFFKIKDLVYEKTEKLRDQKIINANTEAKVILDAKWDQKKFNCEQLKKLLMVAEISFKQNLENEVLVTKSQYSACLRCKLHYGQNQLVLNSNLCLRCNDVINQLKLN